MTLSKRTLSDRDRTSFDSDFWAVAISAHTRKKKERKPFVLSSQQSFWKDCRRDKRMKTETRTH